MLSGKPGTRQIVRPRGDASVHLDALRAFAAFSVLLNHWRDANLIDYSKLGYHNPLLALGYFVTGLGHQWVIVFFVMSGYLVGGSVLSSFQRNTWSWRGYLLTRLTRLLIVLVPALLLGAAWDWTGMHLNNFPALYSGKAGLNELTADVHKTLTPGIMLGNLAFLQTIALPGMHGSRLPAFGTNGPLWSLTNEFWYYIAFPLLVMLLAKNTRWISRLGLASLIALWGWFVGSSIVWLAIPWLIGVVITFLPAELRLSVAWKRTIVAGALGIVTAGLAIAKLFPGTITDVALGVAVAFLVWTFVTCTSGALPHAYEKVAQRGARSSYTLYLVHVPLLIFLTASFHLSRVEPAFIPVLARSSVLIIIMIYAQAVYMLFERNTDAVRRWLKPYVLGR